MSTSYKLYVILPEPADRTSLIHSLHQVLVLAGARLDGDCFLYPSENSETDDDPISVENAEEAIAKFSRNPALGSMDYSALDHMINVSYKGLDDSKIDAIKISVPDSKMAGRGMAFYDDLAKKLHSLLSARRTILGWEPERQGFGWQEEVQRVRNGIFDGKYEVDLHA